MCGARTSAVIRSAALFVMWVVVLLRPAASQVAQPSFTPEETANIQKDTARHFGDAPEDPGPRANLSAAMQPAAVGAAIRKVADWQLATSQPYFDRIWTWSVLYSGFIAASTTLHDPRYSDAMQAMSETYQWQLRSEHPNADDQSRRPNLP